MQKVRVYQLAKELKVQSALILELLDRMGQEVKSDLSVLDLDTADLVRARVTVALEAEKKRIVEERERQRTEAEEEARKLAEQAEREKAPAKPAEPAEEAPAEVEAPSEELPVAAAPAEPPAAPEPPVERPTPAPAPAARKPAAPAKPPAARPAAAKPAETPLPGPTPVPGVRKPRVFPARRIPTPSQLARKKPAPPTTAPRPATPGRPAPSPTGLPGRGAPKKRRKKDKAREAAPAVAARPKQELPPVPEQITLTEGVTVKELAEKLNRKSKDIIAKLIPRGVLATINQPLDPNVAIDVAKEFGSTAKVISFEEEAQQTAAQTPVPEADEFAAELGAEEDSGNKVPRPPVVTVMGHVDHGKTSLLDAFRATSVVESEAGGITQHIGAYQIEEKGRKITFLDTPGHEAFTLMRARGAKATDIVVLVVAADDGVKPQTLEAIDHAKAAGVPIVVAINKIDKPNANVDRVKQQLADRDLLVEDYGGDVVSCEVSAKKRTNLDELLEMILLVADMKELRADPERPAAGVVLEARLDRARGVLATVLVQEGELKAGDPFIAGPAYGKVRAMVDDKGARVTSVGPSTPVEVMGFASEPTAGDTFQAVSDEAKARQIASFRQEKIRAEKQKVSARRTLESLARDIAAGEIKELSVLLKADVQGSIEALQKALNELPSDRVRVNVLRSSIGAITQADVLLAAASNAIVVGFNVRPDKSATDLAKVERVELRMYTVIYDVIDDIKNAMLGLLEPTLREKVLGQAEIRQLFRVPKIGVVGGCYVTEGKVTRNSELRLLRDNVVIFTGQVGSLRRFKDDVSEVKQGYECGIGIANYNDLKEGDVIESFVMEKVAPESL
jgi:translation initiation factor IF-2